MKIDSFRLEQSADDPSVLNLDIFGRVGDVWGVTSAAIAEALSFHADASTIVLRINSPGGSAQEAAAIYRLLVDHPARVEADVVAIAYSAATVILMAADERRMASNALLFLHKTQLSLDAMPVTKAQQMLDLAAKVDAQLVEVYTARTGLDADRVETLLDAETYLSPDEALALGFIDDITPAKTAAAGVDNLAQLVADLPPALRTLAATWKPQPKGEAMAQSNEAGNTPTVTETLAELRAACPGADDAFVLSQLETGATPLAASTAWIGRQQEMIAEQQAASAAELEQQRAASAAELEQAQAAGQGGAGVDAMPTGDGEGVEQSGDPTVAFSQEVAAVMKSGGGSRMEAIQAVARCKPELHRQFLLAQNTGKQRRRLLQEKYDIEDEFAKAK